MLAGEKGAGFQKGLALVSVFLLIAAWRNRNDRAMFFLSVGSLCAIAAVLGANHIPDRILQALALAWMLCMLVAAASALWKLASKLRKKVKHP